MKNNFIVPIVDTDSITICKQNGGAFTETELDYLTDELNKQFNEQIKWEREFYIPQIICLKAKNYILDYGDKIKIKGSALKAATKSFAMKEMIKELIDSLLNNNTNLNDIYIKYVKEACNVKDIKKWAVRKTISDKTLTNERTNEAKIREAIKGTEIVEGDRCYMFTMPDNSLRLVEHFDGNYDVDKLLLDCYNTVKTFKNVLDISLFKNYTLKKNKKELEEMMNGRN